MRKFVDLHLCPLITDLSKVKEIINRSSELGYRLVGVSFPLNVMPDEIRKLQTICNDEQIDLVTRVDLAPKTPRELLHVLRHCRRRFEIVSVSCTKKPVARQAAKDRRVDVLSFPVTDPRKRFFDRAEAELASKTSASLEIDMTQLLYLKGFSRIRLLHYLRKEVAIAKNFHIPITLSSGATTKNLLRRPYDYASLATLFGMNQLLALRAFSENPLTIVERNREKLRPEYIAQGVRIIKRKKDCLCV